MLVHLALLQERIAGLIPERQALVWRDRILTYAELLARSRRVGRALRRLGLGCRIERAALQPWESGHDHVAIYAYNGPAWLEAMLGTLHARAAFVNVNYRYVADELRFVLATSRARAIIYKGLLRNYEVVKPIIAAVKGYCVAGGMEMLQATDIRVAAEDARFAIAEVKHALFPMGGSTVRLARQIPFAKAMEILLTGEQFSAAEALRIGLVNKVVPAAEVMREARRYAELICENGPLAVQAVKRSVLAGLGRPTAEALDKELEFGIPASMSEDAREGTKAFKEKRKPVFKGR